MSIFRVKFGSLKFGVPAALLAATVTLLLGCQEEDTRLFDETGVWALERYALDGGAYVDIAQIRKSLFLLRFKPDDGVVAAAACHEQNTEVNVNGSSCLNAGLSQWSCQCFSYVYDENRMVWQEFTPGDPPPPVSAPGTDEEGGSHELFLSAAKDATATYEFSPLPPGLFNSDGMISKHVFQIKADSVWTGVDKNNDGVMDLEACSQACFPSER
jgi:hypothetical protein